MSPGEAPRGLSRRALLAGMAGSGAVGALAGVGVATATADTGAAGTATAEDSTAESALLRFHGRHQVGITTSPRPFALAAAFRCVDGDRAGLARTLRALTGTARELVEGRTRAPTVQWAPPQDTGVLGADAPAGAAVTVSVGASLFDDRYGLADRRPSALQKMPFLANDRLDPERSHGDLLVTVQADRPDVLAHSLRQLMRATRSGLVLHWLLDGYSRPDPHQQRAGTTQNRNLMGFKDGSANPDARDDALMDQLVWVQPDDDEPGWAVDGSYQAVRVIRMFVEHWDRTPLREQEQIIGRHKVSGSPLGQKQEHRDPAYDEDPRGARIPLDAHIRLANPRDEQALARRVLRRGFNFTRGFDGSGTLDQGLAFISYQRRLAQFLEMQERLKGEPLEEYTLVQGGGFFFALPGVRNERDYLGGALLG